MERYLYKAVLTPCNEGGFEAAIPELGLVTQGSDFADAVYMVQDLLCLEIADRMEAGEPLPTVGRFTPDCPEGSVLVGVMALADGADLSLNEMTADEAADILDVSRSRIYAMARDGILKARKTGNMLMISTESVKERFNAPRKAGRPKKGAIEA